MDTKTWMIGGGVTITAALFYFFTNNKTVSKAAAGGNGTSQAPMPLFISGSGGSTLPAQSQAAQEPLGGWNWAPPTPDLANDPNVAIAKINAEVQNASIAAQKEVALAMIPTNTAVDNTSSRPLSSPKIALDAAGQYIASLGSIDNAAAFNIYDKAREYGLNAYDLAEAAARAGVNMSLSNINNFVSSNNLKPL